MKANSRQVYQTNSSSSSASNDLPMYEKLAKPQHVVDDYAWSASLNKANNNQQQQQQRQQLPPPPPRMIPSVRLSSSSRANNNSNYRSTSTSTAGSSVDEVVQHVHFWNGTPPQLPAGDANNNYNNNIVEDQFMLPSWNANVSDDEHDDGASVEYLDDTYYEHTLIHEEDEVYVEGDEEGMHYGRPTVVYDEFGGVVHQLPPLHDEPGRPMHQLPLNRRSPTSSDQGSTGSADQYQTQARMRRQSSQNYRSHETAAAPESPARAKPLFMTDDFHIASSAQYHHAYAHVDNEKSFYKTPFFVMAAILVALSAVYTSRSTVIATVEQVAMLRLNREKISDQLKSAEKDIMKLKREIAAVDSLLSNKGSNDVGQRQLQAHIIASNTAPEIISSAAVSSVAASAGTRSYEEMKKLRDKLRAQASNADVLKDKVQALGKREVLQKWGDGVYRVEFELVFPDMDGRNGRAGSNALQKYPDGVGPTKFTMELAPVDMMPHSVHTFLEMVSTGLLDGCSFILNALHVLKAAPLPYDGTPASEKAKAFTAHGLESVAFKEYNPDYPHKKYTVGFAADGSPSFYINTEDNSEIHIGDPCFGKVVEGFDTIRRLEACPTRNGIWFEKRVGIKSARLLNDFRHHDVAQLN